MHRCRPGSSNGLPDRNDDHRQALRRRHRAARRARLRAGGRRLPDAAAGDRGEHRHERRARPRRHRRARPGPRAEQDEPVWHAEWEKAAFAHVLDAVPRRLLRRRPVPLRHRADAPGDLPALALLRALGRTPSSTTGWRRACSTRTRSSERTQYYLENPDAPLPERSDPELLAFVDGVVKAGAPAAARVGQGAGVRRRRPGHASIDDSPHGPHPQGPLHPRQDRRDRAGARHDSSTRTAPATAAATPRSTSTRSSSPTRSCGAPRPPSPTASSTSTSGSPTSSRPAREATRMSTAPMNPPKVRTQEEIAARVKALESIMIEKGIMTTEAVDRLVEIYENEVGPQLGAKVVAKAWTDPEFKARLLAERHRGLRRAGHRRPAGRGHGRRREHRHRAQRDRLHAVLVLPVAGARAAAELVQGPAVPRPDRPRAAQGAARGLRPRRARLGRDPRVGLHRRRCATGCCRSVRRAPRTSTRRRSPRSSPATR